MASGTIAKPFTQADLPGQFVVEYVASGAFNIAAGSDGNKTFSIEKTGYTPLGIVGHSFPSSGSAAMCVYRLYLSGSNAVAYCKNNGSNAYTGTIRVYVLYVAN